MAAGMHTQTPCAIHPPHCHPDSVTGEPAFEVRSALAGVERLAFSVTWDMTPEGQILSQWAGRSIIKSCAKLAYGHAQDMIEGTFQGLPDQEPPPVELHGCKWPQVHSVPLLAENACQKLFICLFCLSEACFPSQNEGFLQGSFSAQELL